MKNKKKKKHSASNMRIGTRVTVTTMLAVFVPIMLAIIAGLVFDDRVNKSLGISENGIQIGAVSLMYEKIGYIMISIVLIFILSIIIFSIITSRSITKPIEKLSKGVTEIANGNTDYVIDYDSSNEIGMTVKAFNNMISQLKANNEEKQRFEESRKQMISGVAHDLRTPLTSIKGYVEGLRDGIANTPEKQERYLSTIYSSAIDMEKMLDDLLSLSRLETGNIDIITEPVNIVAMMQDFADDTAFELEKKEIECIYTPPKNDSIMVMLDIDRFYRVLANIVSNAVKYARPNVKGRIQIKIDEYDQSTIISIADNGIGIEKKNLDKIFDTFFRADEARTSVRDGSGIGLSVCKLIVEKHGGRIWATSTLNEGTTIHISLNKTTEHNDEEKSINS